VKNGFNIQKWAIHRLMRVFATKIRLETPVDCASKGSIMEGQLSRERDASVWIRRMKGLFGHGGSGIGWVMLASMVAYAVHCLGRPVGAGRDFGSYWLYYRDFWASVPEYPLVMLYRTPGAPLMFGFLFGFGSWLVVQAYFAVAYCAIAIVLFRVACHWSRLAGWLTVGIVFVSTEFFHVFNTVATENPTSVMFVLWAGYGWRIRRSEKVSAWIVFAALALVLVMIRPNHQILILAMGLPLLNRSLSIKRRLSNSLAFLAVFASGLLGYSGYNYVRYGFFEVAHLTPAHLPFFRVFVYSRMIRPEHGPASAKLGEIVREDVLIREPFVTYGIDEKTFWEGGTVRFWAHIIDAVNRRYGLEHNCAIMGDAAIEALKRYPEVFWLSYYDQLRAFYEFPARRNLRPTWQLPTNFEFLRGQCYQRYADMGLLMPDEDDLIPSSVSHMLFQPDGHPGRVPAEGVPDKWQFRSGSPVRGIGRALTLVGQLRPSSSVLIGFMLLGCLAAVRLRDWDYLYLCSLTGVLTVMHLLVVMSVPEPQYRYTFDPWFALMGCIGFVVLLLQLGECRSCKEAKAKG